MNSSKPRLWIISELFPPDESSTSYILGEIAKIMLPKYDVNVICGPIVYDKNKSLSDSKLPDEIKIYRINGLNLDKNTIFGKIISFILITYRLHKMAKSKISRNDKVLMVTNPATLIVAISRLKRDVGFSLGILVHDVFPENAHAGGIMFPSAFYRKLKQIFDKAYSRADRLIVLGRDMEEVLREKTLRYSPNIKISIIENWADIENITPEPFPTGPIKLQYAGNIGRVQGLPNVIHHLPDNIEFHIYGTGALENKLKKIDAKNVFFHGAYRRSEQSDILGQCDIALVTLSDGMYGLGVPSKTYNILASGRPVLFLGPENSEIYRLVKEKGIGYSNWPQKWDREELKEMGAKARKVAEEEYSEDIILQKFVQLI